MRNAIFGLLFFSFWASAQTTNDSKYREDQLYATIGYPLLLDAPEGVTQNKLSHTFSFGFIRDMPFTANRNLALGVGLGVAYNVIYTNYQYDSIENSFLFVPNDIVNQWNSSEIEIPIEFRWRDSSPTNYHFWRVYAGIVGYYTLNATQHSRNGLSDSKTALSLDKFRLAFRLNVGNNTWNLTYSFPIDTLFETIEPFQNKPFSTIKYAKLGLIFYIF